MSDSPAADPAATRDVAVRLRADAERLHDRTRHLDQRLDALEFQGPAALRMRAATVERKLRADQIAAELRDISLALSQSCG
jgi:hypothetical protein